MSDSGEIRVFAPATVANLGPGFDALGLALSEPGDEVVARPADRPGVSLAAIQGDGGRLPVEPDRNTAAIAAAAVLRAAGSDAGVELELHKGMPIGSGLGSSAASAAAGAVAANELLGAPFAPADLIGPCVEAEEHVSGRHADNVAPALLGGLVLVRSIDPLDVASLAMPAGLTLAVVTPVFELPTREARAVLPEELPLGDAIEQWSGLAAMVHALHVGDLDLLGRAMQADRVATPARIPLIPGGRDAIDAACAAGALGSSISGAGPSIFALCRNEEDAGAAGQAMRLAFRNAGLDASLVISPANCPGARLR
jgi:homoserine kinase